MTAWNESLLAAIYSKNHVVLATHVNPDGDALGSLLGLADILEGMGKQVVRYFEEPVSSLYSFLPDLDRVQTDLDEVLTFAREADNDVITICLDCGDMQRLGKSGPKLMEIHPFLVIDHHKGNSGFGDLSWIEPHRSSTGEMIFDLAEELGQDISTKAANCLYTAIVTDTGSFHYDSTSSHTFNVAAKLVEYGVKPEAISSNLYNNYSPNRLRLMQQVLATLRMFADDQIAVIRLTGDMLKTTGTTMEEADRFINLPRAISSVQVAVFLKESGEEQVSVSLRAKGSFDVSTVAAKFGGGGHQNASGFRLYGCSSDEVLERLLPVLRKGLYS